MAVYRTASGFGVDWRDEFGTRHRRFVGSEEAARALDAKLREGVHTAKAAITRTMATAALDLPAAADLYLAHVASPDHVKRQLHSNLHAFARRLGQSELSKITPRLLESYFDKRRVVVAAWTAYNELAQVRRWFRWLKQEGVLAANPAAALELPKPKESSARAIGYDEERELLHNLTASPRLRCLLAIDAGCSVSETLLLRARNYDRLAHTINVTGTRRHRDRLIPATLRLDAELREHCRHLSPDALLFSRAGRAIQDGSQFIRSLRRTWPVPFRFHDLRHTFATRLAAASGNQFLVVHALGHSVQTLAFGKGGRLISTSTQYVHPTLDELRAAIAAMERANPNCRQEGDQP
jgi:integrase